MVISHRNPDGNIIFLADYEIVNKDGTPDSGGLYCYIRYAYFDKSIRGTPVFRNFVMREHMKYPKVKWIYYQRSNRGDHRKRIFDIKRFYKKGRNNEQ